MQFEMKKTKCFSHKIIKISQYIMGLSILRKVHRVIQFYQIAWLKPYIDINTELREKAKNHFEMYFFKSLYRY